MSNVKISALPTWSGTSADLRWFVMNNQGETETFKFSGWTSQIVPGDGSNSVRSIYFASNKNLSPYGVLIGGLTTNTINSTGNYNTIVGGEGCTIQAGEDNGIFAAKNSTTDGSSSYSAIIGGRTHTANNQFAFIGGGAQNTCGYLSAAVGGFNLNATNQTGVFGGENNTANGAYSTILGGTGNSASGNYSSVFDSKDSSATQYMSLILNSESSTCNNASGGNTPLRQGLINSLSSTINGGNRVVGIGLSGRTFGSGRTGWTATENLFVYGQIEQQEEVFDGSSSTVDINISRTGLVELTATGGTYNINIDPATSNVGLELTLMIHYYSAATINFVSAGVTQWKFGNNAGTPVFSGNNNYNILVFRSWDGNDLYEQSRSLYMS